MKNLFVLDECTVLSASKLKNEKDEIDFSTSYLIHSIAYNCHKILITQTIYQKYLQKFSQLSRYKNVHINNAFIHLLNQLMVNSEKIIWESDAVVEFPPKSFDPDDYPYVSLASKRHAILVTSDNKLICNLNDSSITKAYNFQAKRPENAINDAM